MKRVDNGLNGIRFAVLILGVVLSGQNSLAYQPDPYYSFNVTQTEYHSAFTQSTPAGAAVAYQKNIDLDPGAIGPFAYEKTDWSRGRINQYGISYTVVINDLTTDPTSLETMNYLANGQITSDIQTPSSLPIYTPLQFCAPTNWTDASSSYTFQESAKNQIKALSTSQMMYLYGVHTHVYVDGADLPPTQIKVAGLTCNANANVTLALSPGGATGITPNPTPSRPKYEFCQSGYHYTFLASVDNYGTLDPPEGPGLSAYGWNPSTRANIVTTAGTQSLGVLRRVGNVLGILMQLSVTTVAEINNTTWSASYNLQQDIACRTYLYQPPTNSLAESFSDNIDVKNHSVAPNTSNPAGNDSTAADNTPDSMSGIYLADVPQLSLTIGSIVAARNGSIISFRGGFRNWLMCGGGVIIPFDGSGWKTWNMNITIQKTSEPGISPITYREVTSYLMPGTGEFEVATINELRQIYLSN